MKHLIEDIWWMYEKNLVLEMANMQPRRTGLNFTVHVMSKGGAKHVPRVKVSNISDGFSHDDNFSITVENVPRVVGNFKLKKEHLDDIIDWVNLNREHLHKVWNDGDIMTSSEVSDGFHKLGF